jgi:hypothetical protein
VVTTVTACEHKPEVDRNCWPLVEVTVAVHGTTAIKGAVEMVLEGGIPASVLFTGGAGANEGALEVVVLESVLPLIGDANAA